MLDRLVDAGVFEDHNGELVVTDPFVDDIDANKQRLKENGGQPNVFSKLGLDEEGPVAVLDVTDELFLSEYAALADRVPTAESQELIRWTILLDQFGDNAVPTEGTPEAFLPVSGEKLQSCLKLFSPAIVYVWREDCDPCDLVRDDFDRLLSESLSDIALFSVYGPDNAVLLSELYDVEGGPTVLFVRNGEVDVRLVGAHSTATLENEIDVLREYV